MEEGRKLAILEFYLGNATPSIAQMALISKDVIGVAINQGIARLTVDLSVTNEENFRQSVEDFLEKMRRFQSKTPQTSRDVTEASPSMDLFETFKKKGLVVLFGEGVIAFHGIASKLFYLFSEELEKLALSIGATPKTYPILLSTDSYKKTGYLATSAQYSHFCCAPAQDFATLGKIQNAVDSGAVLNLLSEPAFVLSPSACFHVYDELRNSSIIESNSITLSQRVFRNESRLTWNEFGRLREYTVREIVFLGTPGFVQERLDLTREISQRLFQDLGIACTIALANDPFVLPVLELLKQKQLYERSKLELRVKTLGLETVACASFNFHGSAFTGPFGIGLRESDECISGCVGFGIDRLVLCFLAQYGTDELHWPTLMREKLKELKT